MTNEKQERPVSLEYFRSARPGRHGHLHHHHRRRGSGLGALLIDRDERLVNHRTDAKLLRRRHAGKVGLVGKRVHHAHRLERPGQGKLRGELELRQRELDRLALESGKVLVQFLWRERLLQRRQAVDLPRQQDYHRQVVVHVRQLDHLEIVAPGVLETLLLVHQGHRYRLVSRDVERSVLRGVLAERVRPAALEVDGVGKHQAREFVEHAGGDQVLDFITRLFFDPIVDRLSGGGGLAEVHVVKTCAVVLLHQCDELRSERIVLRAPQLVGDGQLVDGLFFVVQLWRVNPPNQFAERPVKSRRRPWLGDLFPRRGTTSTRRQMHPRRFARKTKHLGHLFCRLASRPGVGHRKCGLYACRGEKDIALRLGCQLPVHRQRERGVTPRECVDVLLQPHVRGRHLSHFSRRRRRHRHRNYANHGRDRNPCSFHLILLLFFDTYRLAGTHGRAESSDQFRKSRLAPVAPDAMGISYIHVTSDRHALLSLSWPGLYPQLGAVLDRARQAGVVAMICAAGDLRESIAAGRVARERENVFCTADVHPHDAKNVSVDTLAEIAELAGDPKNVAVGEIGLDYHYDFSPREDQRRTFEAQLDIARRAGKIVVIHTREAFDDTLSILRDSGADTTRVVFHSFTGDARQARRILELGAMVSFSGIATFRNAWAIRDAVAMVPDDRIVIKTDSPYLSPEPVSRMKTNEPAVAHVATSLGVGCVLRTNLWCM